MTKKGVVNSPVEGFWQKPQLSKFLAVGYLIFPAIYWWQARYGSAGMDAAAMSSWVFARELFCAVTAATALLCVTKPSLFYLIFLSVYFVGFKIFQFSTGVLESPTQIVATMFWFAAPTALLASQARLAYTEPARRWWKRPERHTHTTGAQALCRGIKFPLVVINFSRSGAFVKLDERIFQQQVDQEHEKRDDGAGRFPSVSSAERLIALRNMREYPGIGDEINIAIETLPGLDSPFKANRFAARARVVWVTKATDPYQYGLGLQFMRVSFMNQLRLRRYFKLIPAPKS